jgi:hypothetical protein
MFIIIPAFVSPYTNVLVYRKMRISAFLIPGFFLLFPHGSFFSFIAYLLLNLEKNTKKFTLRNQRAWCPEAHAL